MCTYSKHLTTLTQSIFMWKETKSNNEKIINGFLARYKSSKAAVVLSWIFFSCICKSEVRKAECVTHHPAACTALPKHVGIWISALQVGCPNRPSKRIDYRPDPSYLSWDGKKQILWPSKPENGSGVRCWLLECIKLVHQDYGPDEVKNAVPPIYKYQKNPNPQNPETLTLRHWGKKEEGKGNKCSAAVGTLP